MSAGSWTAAKLAVTAMTPTVLDIVEWYNPATADSGDSVVSQHQRGLTRFAVLTDDTQKVYDELSDAGMTFLTQPTSVLTPEGGWKVCLITDPDNVVVQVTQLLPAKERVKVLLEFLGRPVEAEVSVPKVLPTISPRAGLKT